MKIIIYLCRRNQHNYKNNGWQPYLFAYGITDGALDYMSEEERTAMIIDITEAMLKAGDNTPNEFK